MRGCAGRCTELLLHFTDRRSRKHHCQYIINNYIFALEKFIFVFKLLITSQMTCAETESKFCFYTHKTSNIKLCSFTQVGGHEKRRGCYIYGSVLVMSRAERQRANKGFLSVLYTEERMKGFFIRGQRLYVKVNAAVALSQVHASREA